MPSNPTGSDRCAEAARNSKGAHSLAAKAVEEFRRFVVLSLYLWVLLAMFVVNQSIVLREQGIHFSSQGFALINALVLAKVMLLFEAFDPGRWLRRRPLIYPILFEAFLLTILFLIVHIVEKAIEGLIHGRTVLESLPSIGGGSLVGLLSVTIILFIALIPFFAFRNLGLVLGQDRLIELVFGSKAGSSGASEP
ncbi:hypothetical protein [Rhodoblastus sp.]|uniref:hypothetical protein n=1 Tax=Rhodoblastus sp. TaxID=1962975 RepID=UPI003F970271